jgi:hypothetical protein
MGRVVMIVVAIAGFVLPAQAQQQDTPPSSSLRGPAFPSPDSNRGPAFPKSVSPAGSNPTNWVAPQPEYTEPAPTWSNRPGEQWRGWRR